MTEKKQRFWISKTNSHELYIPIDEMKTYIFSSFESELDCMRVVRALNELAEENEQLKKRNNNQYNQLNQLWQLIEAKDWETLTAMNNQMKKDEERLQQEWKCYE